MSKPCLYLHLCGGLGNQLFQYACARAITIRNDIQLVLDPWSGFVRDFRYKRKYALAPFATQSRLILPHEVFPVWLYRWYLRSHNDMTGSIQQLWFGRFVNESSLEYLSSIKDIKITSNTWFLGYWQSPRYFSDITSCIRRELQPPSSSESNYLSISKQILNCESVALGIRLYEESLDPSAHSRSGSLKSAADIQSAVDKLLSVRPSASFFIFCTHQSALFEKLKLPDSTVFLTGDNGFTNPVDTLWLLTLCRHHIFTNSTFFWWGAWLSRTLYSDQTILASDNFSNQDTICNDWNTF